MAPFGVRVVPFGAPAAPFGIRVVLRGRPAVRVRKCVGSRKGAAGENRGRARSAGYLPAFSFFFAARVAAAATAPSRMKSITGARMSLIALSVAACVFAMR